MVEEKENEYIDIFLSRTLKEYLLLCNRTEYKIIEITNLINILSKFLGID